MKRFGQELIELEAAGNETRLRERAVIRTDVRAVADMPVKEGAVEISTPPDPISKGLFEVVMNAAVRMVGEIPTGSLMDFGGVERPSGPKPVNAPGSAVKAASS